MKHSRYSLLVAPLAATICYSLATSPALATSLFGTLCNFDVINDTGGETEGFEIELDGLSSSDVTYTFGGTYIRYGNPVLVNFAGGVYVRYQSKYDALHKIFVQKTPIPTNFSPVTGHSCWTGGSAGYLTSGCEHFGVSLSRNPTASHYRWLVADPSKPGNLIRFGTDVSIPAPVWSVIPGVGGPIIRAAIEPEPAPIPQQFGPAKWVKIYVTESAVRVALNHLLSDDPAVPQDPSQTEIAWEILQSNPNGNSEKDNDLQSRGGDESITRRYEFFKYTGAYDLETNEVICGGDGGCNAPQPGELGDYIGAQMAEGQFVPGTQVQSAHVTLSGFVYSSVSHTYAGTVSVKNVGAQPIAGPVEVVFANLPPQVTLANAAGNFQGSPFVFIPSLHAAGTSLAPNQTASFSVQFNSRSALALTPAVYSGSLQ